MLRTAKSLLVFTAMAAGMPFALAQDDVTDDEAGITEITVEARRVANTRPAGTFAAPATMLRFDPLTELQSRGLPEGQADVTVRGSLFENTGFKAGAVTVMDPQTGHYVAELPIDPAFLGAPDIRTGIDNALAGFNSNVATVSYTPVRLQSGGELALGAGSDALRFATLRTAAVIRNTADEDLAIALSVAGSEGDGSVANGDHEFRRYNLQLQRGTARSQSDLVLAYQDKFYGWPGAYTGFASLAETDDTQTTLVLANHRQELEAGWWQVGAFYRRLVDDYDFNRTTEESGVPGSFDHETRIAGAGFDGELQAWGLDWSFGGQLTTDELVRSTDLTNSRFTSRDYATLSVVPALRLQRSEQAELLLRFGATVDYSNRDGSEFSPQAGVTLQRTTSRGVRSVALEYSATSQLPGYTVLGSGPSGLFGGNAGLGRETARQLSLSLAQEADSWRAVAAVFYREDDDLVDWTFASSSPFARQANPVDIDVMGFELLYGRQWDALEISVGYTWLDKDADYGTAEVDASFYALNFARHRATLAVRYRLGERLELRIDNEYREQEANSLRSSADQAFHVAASLAWEPAGARGFGVALTADNLTDDDYQQFPGTPAIGRQVSLSARYAW